MKGTVILAVAVFCAAGKLYAQQRPDIFYRNNNIIVKKSRWSKDDGEDTSNIAIELSNKSRHGIKNAIFEIVANDKQGARLKTDSGYSRKLFSAQKLPPNSTGIYRFTNLFTDTAAPEEIRISNIHIDYEGGTIEDIRLDLK